MCEECQGTGIIELCDILEGNVLDQAKPHYCACEVGQDMAYVDSKRVVCDWE